MGLVSTKYFVNIIFTTNTTNRKFSFSVNKKRIIYLDHAAFVQSKLNIKQRGH